ncbi:hypothetical protein [Chryseobacterium schmidteae]|uniref:hypothetical protein n=1 Tax=Chryseobacterium schmidteae TaxID=2730404 RepID=UPI00158CDACE|nr:hypothetical protein [Chryseobacterium schmidteae]
MSKFLLEKKKLIEDVYEKASKETTETSFSGVLLHLEQVLKDDFESLSYKSFENYYKALVENDEDYKIKPSILDNLSNYLGFESFNDYCSGWKSFEYKIHQALSNLVITVINKPILKMPEFLTKQSSLGIAGFIIVGLFLTGNIYLSNKKNNQESFSSFGFLSSVPEKKKECMYWDKNQYKPAYCDDRDPHKDLKPIDTVALKYFKMITRKDTLTVDNAFGKVWYSKSNGNVEFFTMDGIDPQNGKDLRFATEYMIDTYAGQ